MVTLVLLLCCGWDRGGRHLRVHLRRRHRSSASQPPTIPNAKPRFVARLGFRAAVLHRSLRIKPL